MELNTKNDENESTSFYFELDRAQPETIRDTRLRLVDDSTPKIRIEQGINPNREVGARPTRDGGA